MSKEPSKNQDIDEQEFELESDIDLDFDNNSPDFLKKINKLKVELDKCKKDKQEYLDGWQRAKADFVNFKKRNEEDRKSLIKIANEDLILDLIPILDSFDMAFNDQKSWSSVSENWRKGIEYIYNQMLSVLSTHGVKQVNPIDQEFDLMIHQSVETVEGQDGKIINVVLKGYSLSDKIIRAPQVRVGKKT